MKTTVEVENRAEAAAVQAAVANKEHKALIIVLGVMEGLPSDRARRRLLAFVGDSLDEREAQGALPGIA